MSGNSRWKRALAALALASSAVVLSASAASGAPREDLPFRVTIDSYADNDGTFCASGAPRQVLTGTGHATHMGRITVTGVACAGGDGVANWIAANGDTITIEFSTVLVGPGPDGSIAVEFPANDVMGTGRFANVVLTGPLLANVYLNPDGSAYLDAWLESTISYDASDRSAR